MATFTKEIRQKGITYRAEIRKEGKRLTRRFPNLTLAKQWATQTEAEIIKGSFLPVLKRHTLAEAIERYEKEIIPNKKSSTQELHTKQLAWFKKEFGSHKLQQISNSTLIKAREMLKKETFVRQGTNEVKLRANGTLNRYFVPLMNLFHVACNDWEWMREVPKMPRLKEAKGRTRFLTQAEARKLIEALNKDSRKDLRLISLISISLGSRLFETCALKWEEIDLLNKVISFTETKNSEIKCLPISDSLYAEIISWRALKKPDSPYLFPTAKKSKLPHVYAKVRQGFVQLTQKLGMPDVTFHTLRHSVGSWTTQMGVNRKIVGDLLGHMDLRTTDRYSHLDVSHLRGAADQVEELVFGGGKLVLNKREEYEQ